MTDRPILFSGPMVRALLDGSKTQTRRVLLQQPTDPQIGGAVCDPVAFPERPYVWLNGNDGSPVHPIINPPNVLPGDRLYVREAWFTGPAFDHIAPRDLAQDVSLRFDADREPGMEWAEPKCRFRQGMHMPRWASRLTLIVTDVRVQPLWQITDEDALAEGYPYGATENIEEPVSEFAKLWDGLNEARGYGFQSNPWVVAYSFEVRHGNIDQI